MQATLQVKEGKAVYERDGVLFDHIEYSWPLLANLMWRAARNKGHLHVIDFGGSLGSTYFQNKKFLDSLASVTWNVIEQPGFIEAGRKHIQSDRLFFFNTVEECIQQQGMPDVLLLACTLPYIEKPYELLTALTAHKIPCLIIENTPFNDVPGNRLTIQRVPPAIYEATYPAWFLDYEQVRSSIAAAYEIHSEHTNETVIYLDGRPIPYRGFTALLKNNTDENH